MADGGGPTEQDRSEGMPSLSEAPNERGKSALVTFALFKVTRCKGGTNSGRYRSNGYVHQTPNTPNTKPQSPHLIPNHSEQPPIPPG